MFDDLCPWCGHDLLDAIIAMGRDSAFDAHYEVCENLQMDLNKKNNNQSPPCDEEE